MAGRPRVSLPVVRRAATFGAADGVTVLIGLLISLASDPGALFRAALGASVAELVGMSAGQWLSDEAAGPVPAIANGSASFLACFIPVLPFLWLHGMIAIVVSVILVVAVATAITSLREERGFRAFTMTFGVLALAAVLCWAATLI